MKISKTLTVLASSLMLIGVLASCGETSQSVSNSESPSETPSESPSVSDSTSPSTVDEDVEISFWHTMGQTNMETLNGMITKFNEKFPHIKVTHAAQGGYDDIKTKISAAIPAGTTPTMAYCYPDHVAEYMEAGAVEEMTPYIDSPTIGLGVEDGTEATGKSDFINAYWQEGSTYSTSGVYSLPFSKSTEVLFYNKTFFDANGLDVPTTWDEFETVAAQIKAINSKVIPLGYDSDANLFITMCQQYGIPYTSATGDHYLFNNAQAKAMVQKLKDWHTNGLITTMGTSPNSAYTSTQFVAGSLMMTIGSTGGTTYNDAGSSFDVGVAAIPQASETTKSVISQGPSIVFFKRATQAQKNAAWLFYKWISNTKNSAVYSVLTGYNPVRTSSFVDPLYTERKNGTSVERLITAVSILVPTIESWYFTSPAFKGSSTARIEVGGIITQVLLGEKTIDQAFTDAMTNCVFAS